MNIHIPQSFSLPIRFAASLTAGFFAVIVAGCRPEAPAVQAPARSVIVVRSETRDIEERIVATGQLLAKRRAQVASQVDGEVTQVFADEGDSIEAGEVLLAIDPELRALEKQYAKARRNEMQLRQAEAQREAARVRELSERSVASQAMLDHAEAALHTAQAQERAFEAQLGIAARALHDANVRARFSGILARRYVGIGEYVRRGDALFDLVSAAPLEFEFHLPEREAGRVRVGLPLHVKVTPYPDDEFPATISMVSPAVDPRTRTLRVKAHIANDDGLLKPGFFARADLGIDRRENVVMVPDEAVLQRSDGTVLFRVTDDVARWLRARSSGRRATE